MAQQELLNFLSFSINQTRKTYLGNNLAGPEPGGLIGRSGGSQEEPNEVLQEDIAIRSMIWIMSGGKNGDESNDALCRGYAPLEVKERE